MKVLLFGLGAKDYAKMVGSFKDIKESINKQLDDGSKVLIVHNALKYKGCIDVPDQKGEQFDVRIVKKKGEKENH